MARARKTTPAKTDTEGAQAPVIPAAIAADEQPGAGAGEVAVAQAADLSGENSSPVAQQVILTITGPKRGRRRAGRAFGPEPVRISAADLSEAERRVLEADPSLKIDVSSVPG